MSQARIEMMYVAAAGEGGQLGQYTKVLNNFDVG